MEKKSEKIKQIGSRGKETAGDVTDKVTDSKNLNFQREKEVLLNDSGKALRSD